MGGGGGGKGGSSVQTVEAPVVSATAPQPSQVAEAPKITETNRSQETNKAKRKGASALRIDLNIGGAGNSGRSNTAGADSGNGLSIPRDTYY